MGGIAGGVVAGGMLAGQQAQQEMQAADIQNRSNQIDLDNKQAAQDAYNLAMQLHYQEVAGSGKQKKATKGDATLPAASDTQAQSPAAPVTPDAAAQNYNPGVTGGQPTPSAVQPAQAAPAAPDGSVAQPGPATPMGAPGAGPPAPATPMGAPGAGPPASAMSGSAAAAQPGPATPKGAPGAGPPASAMSGSAAAAQPAPAAAAPSPVQQVLTSLSNLIGGQAKTDPDIQQKLQSVAATPGGMRGLQAAQQDIESYHKQQAGQDLQDYMRKYGSGTDEQAMKGAIDFANKQGIPGTPAGFKTLTEKQPVLGPKGTPVLDDEGNPTMLIWLGKQYMGQADKSEVLRKSESIQSIDISALKPDQLVELVQAIDKIKAMMAQPAEVLSIENVERLQPIVESEPVKIDTPLSGVGEGSTSSFT